MRKFLIPMIAAGSVFTIAAPASAQQHWTPPVYQYQPYNYVRGFSGVNFAQSMQARVQRIRNDVRLMQSRRVLSWAEARSLDTQARSLQHRIYRASRGGLNAYEARDVENRIRRLEVRVAREANDWNRRYGRRRHY
ncbi:MAG: hypothetical protein ABIO80_02055 [Sphingomicrobium sp.]